MSDESELATMIVRLETAMLHIRLAQEGLDRAREQVHSTLRIVQDRVRQVLQAERGEG